MPLTQDQTDELLEQAEPEGNAVLLPAPTAALPAGAAVPAAWRALLARPDAHRRVVQELWGPVARRLPATAHMLSSRVQALALLLTDSEPPSLLYAFTESADVFAHRGFAPAEALPPEAAKLPVDLTELYRVHDGWVDLFGGDAGPLPASKWRRVPSLRDPGAGGFLELFTHGATSMGFDLTETPPQCLELRGGDEEVERVADFWARLDEWLSADLEDMDVAGP